MGKRTVKSISSDELPTKKSHWSLGLLASMNDLKFKVSEDDSVVVIKDKYPKAQLHYLVLPKEDIPGILNVTKEHEDLLEHMEKIGERLTKDHPDHDFNIGYHALPSMHRLHLHVISTDFVSTHLKTKHHWNSFTSPYFRRSQDVRKELHEYGRIKKLSSNDCVKYLKADLKCHRCSTILKNMPKLKSHLLTHLSNKKSSLQTRSTLSS